MLRCFSSEKNLISVDTCTYFFFHQTLFMRIFNLLGCNNIQELAQHRLHWCVITDAYRHFSTTSPSLKSSVSNALKRPKNNPFPKVTFCSVRYTLAFRLDINGVEHLVHVASSGYNLDEQVVISVDNIETLVRMYAHELSSGPYKILMHTLAETNVKKNCW